MKVKTSKISLYFLMVLVLAILAVGVGIEGQWPITGYYGVKRSYGQPRASSAIVVGNLPTVKVKITAFSPIECKTTFCRTHEIKGNQIALNAKFGKVNQVYVKELDKKFDVIGTTDQKTDADIFMDYESAKQFGVHYYHITIL